MKFLKLIFIFSGISALLTVLVICALYYLISNSLPRYQQELESSKITHNITISRDTYAIPYIETKNDLDSFFALGYTHAQDRLWQMVLLRRTAQGRLSEIIGSTGFKSDKLMRTLGLYRSAERSEIKQTDDIRMLLNAYSDGINFYIKQISEKSLGRGSPEFFLFTSEISPWRPADSIALLKLIAFQSTNKAEVEIFRTQILLAQIKPDRYADLFLEPPLIDNIQNQTLSYLKNQILPLPRTQPIEDQQGSSSLFTKNIDLIGSLSASNIFAVMPSRSATGLVLAANDPHGVLTSPSNFMLVNLKLTNGSVTGGTIPGIPAVIIGRSKNFGWGISNAEIDDQDLFIEKINPQNKMEYFTRTRLAKFDVRNEIIKIKGENSITISVKSTKNGPILEGDLLGVNLIRPKGHEISIKWTGLSNEDRSIEALIEIMRSPAINQAKKNLPLLKAPGQNVLLVDPKNIEMITAGIIPKRDARNSTKGKIPALGWKKENNWFGEISFDRHPHIKNPESGIVVNTNNKTTDAPFPFHVSYDWGDSQRIIRASRLLNKRKFHTVGSFKEIQTDTVSVSARILLPLLAKNLWFGQQADQNFKAYNIEERVLKKLSKWNGDMNQNYSEPLIFVSWLREFQSMVMVDELGSLYNKIHSIKPLFLERVLRNKNGASEWCDIIQTSEEETCEKLAKRSLSVAVRKLQNQFGSKIEDWRWGDPHLAIHKAQIIGSWPLLSFFSNIVHEISGGDNTMMMSRMVNLHSPNFIASYGTTLRTIYDFSNQDHSLFISSTGQSGHFLSPHYDDQAILMQQDQYIPVSYDILERQGGSTATTTFYPIKKEN